MAWEYDSGEETRDRTPLIWAGVVLALVGMLFALWTVTRSNVQAETRAHISHILFRFDPLSDEDRQRALDKAQTVRQEILNGAKFDVMAKQHSEDEFTKDRAGDMGFLPKGILTKPVDLVVWQQPIGQVSGVVESQYGFHLVMVHERSLSKMDRYEQTIRDRVYGNAGRTQDEQDDPQ
jgi:parvulin-like peptidyl-prolyl isomerase